MLIMWTLSWHLHMLHCSKPETQMTALVLREDRDGLAVLTLNRPEKRNAMNPALNARMLEVLDELEGDERCGVLVLRGAGACQLPGQHQHVDRARQLQRGMQ